MCLLGFVASGLNQTSLAQPKQPMDEDSTERVWEWTTAPGDFVMAHYGSNNMVTL